MKIHFLMFISMICLTSCFTDQDDDIEAYSYTGSFISKAHPTTGMVSINKENNILSLSNFKSDSGPQLELYLATNAEATNFISLGSLKGLDGNYEYALPENIDFSTYKYVIVWCVQFDVNFGQAILAKD